MTRGDKESASPGAGHEVWLTARLARRLSRSGGWLSAASTVFVAALFAMAMFVVLTSLSLSGAQEADRDLGRFDAAASAQISLPPGEEDLVNTLRQQVLAAGVKDAAVMLTALDVQLDSVPARDVTMLEGNWQARPFPGRYELSAGRWPKRPGEIVVTDPGDVSATPGTQLTVLSDVSLQVVGTADDLYASSTNLLAAPGTWSRLDPALSKGYPALSAQPFVLWSGGGMQDVRAAAAAAVASYAAASGTQDAALSNDASGKNLVGAGFTRAQLTADPADYWIRKAPAGYAVPAVLVPAGAVLLMFGLTDRRLRRSADTMIACGLRPATTVAAVTLACLAWCLAATLAGAVAGSGLGWALRPLLEELQDRPAGDIAGLTTAGIRLLATVAVAGLCTGGGLLIARRARTAPRRGELPESESATSRSGPKGRSRLRDARHLAALAAWCACVVFAMRVDTPAEGMVLTGLLSAAVLLGLPEIFGRVVRLLPEREPRRRLARRQLQADTRRAHAALAVLTVLIGASLGFLALLDTLIRSTEDAAHPEVLPGQILLASRDSPTFPPPEGAVRAIEASKTLDGLPQVEFRYLSETTVEDTDPMPTAYREEDQTGLILATDDPADVEIMLGQALTAEQAALLKNGGMLVWADSDNAPEPGGGKTRLTVYRGERTLARTPTLSTLPVELPPTNWRNGSEGIVLTATAHDLDLPLAENGPIMFGNVDEEDGERVQQALQEAGFDAGTAHIYVTPEPPVPPVALFVTAGALALLTLAAVLTAVRGQTRALRGYLAALVALGIPPAWGRHILLWQHALLLGASTLLGLFIAVVPNLVVVSQITGFRLSIPWGQMALLLAAIALASALAVTRSALTLRWRS